MTAVEYGLILALIAGVIITGLLLLGAGHQQPVQQLRQLRHHAEQGMHRPVTPVGATAHDNCPRRGTDAQLLSCSPPATSPTGFAGTTVA